MNTDPLGSLVAYSLALGGLLLAAVSRIAQLAQSTESNSSIGVPAAMTDAELADEEALLAHPLWWRLEWPL